MKFLTIFFLCSVALILVDAEPGKCFDRTEGCHSTNYESYVECIRRRQKRSVNCDSSCDSDNCIDTCSNCDCDSCNYSTCNNACNSCCSSCCSNFIPCKTNHCCHKTCHAQCKSTSCRTSCRKSCYNTVEKGSEEVTNEENFSNNTSNNNVKHNVTTIIHLNNIINNTNVIDIPITINNTNRHNITLRNLGTYSEAGISGQNNSRCCIVISPRQCVPHNESPFVRCFHYRSRQCGEFCTSSIVHKEQQTICQSLYPGDTTNCRQQVMYIPQPQPRCTYQSTWPYVSCGIQQSASCGGCYNHYVDQNSKAYLNCPTQCYDDGYGIGPYFRQGPVYRPGYTHIPCFQCLGYDGSSQYNGIGGYTGITGYSNIPAYGGYGYGGYPIYPYGNTGIGAQSGAVGIPNTMPFGSWSPGEVNSFETAPVNGTSFIRSNNTISYPDPLVMVGPGFQNPYINTIRPVREVEIELNYDTLPSKQAEVKIRKNKNVLIVDKTNSTHNNETSKKNDNTTDTSSTITNKLA